MNINPEITEILKECKIDKDRGLFCLLGYYFSLDVDKICDEDTIKAINLTKIVDKDYTRANAIKWNTPLFEGQNTQWDWVNEEYNSLWRVAPSRKDSNPDCTKRMQEFFRKYPQYRKDDVLRATKEYFKSVKDPQYLKSSAKFIFDGAGNMKKSMLLAWCEKLQPATAFNTNMKGKLL